MNIKDSSNFDLQPPHVSSTLSFDPERYLEHAKDFQMSEAEKTEFLQTLWDIMATFVRLGFGVESVLPTIFQRALENGAAELEQTIPTHDFNIAADDDAAKKEE